jgi:hypothetical protein
MNPKSSIVILILLLMVSEIQAQDRSDELPYREIPDAPESYSPGGVVSRLIDGLGFRFYWATEGLRDEDLTFRPGEKARSTGETVDHIYGLSQVILNSALKKPNTQQDPVQMSFGEKRAAVLNMLKQAS